MRKVLLGLTLMAIFASCGVKGKKEASAFLDKDANEISVLYFHGKQRCVTCNAIERLTKEVVDSLGAKNIVMRVVDISKDEATADKYQVTWSSLILDHNGKTDNLTDMGFAYAKNKPEVFKAKLTDAINKIR